MRRSSIHDDISRQELRNERREFGLDEAFPYGDSLRSVMEKDVYTCGPDTSVRDAVKEMARRGISSVVIVRTDGTPAGILTERDILKKVVAADGMDVDKTPVSAVMTTPLITLRPDDTIYRSLSLLSSRNIKHLPLVKDNKVTGIVSMRQILKLRYPEAVMLIEGIHSATDVIHLKEIKNQIPQLVASKLRRGIPATDIVVMISLINEDIQLRTLELAFKELGNPPADFCLFVSGSHGRMENLLTPDQDHGMIIDDKALDDEAASTYFMKLGEFYSRCLTEAGFEFCPGYIMSMNPTWRKTLFEWKVQIRYWFERQMPGLVRYMTIIFDAKPIWGNTELFTGANVFAHTLISKHYEVLRIMHEEEGAHRAPLGMFGRFITEKSGSHRGEINMKRSGLIFVVEGVRILALRHGIKETSTVRRLRALGDGGYINPNDGEYFEASYRILLEHALRSQVKKAIEGEPINAYVDPRQLSSREKEMLRHAYKAVLRLQDLVATEFGELVI